MRLTKNIVDFERTYTLENLTPNELTTIKFALLDRRNELNYQISHSQQSSRINALSLRLKDNDDLYESIDYQQFAVTDA